MSHRRRRPADESAQSPVLIVESALRRLDVTLGIKRGEFLRQAVGLQRRLVGFGQIPVNDQPAGLPGDLGGKLRERIGAIAGELVDPARLAGLAREKSACAADETRPFLAASRTAPRRSAPARPAL